jgi:preprotein translocase subunit SecA
MITQFFSNFLGNKNEREVNRIRPLVARINQIEESLQRAEPSRLVDLTAEWKRHLARYHPIEMPPRYAIEAMNEGALLALANAVEARFAKLRSEFSGLPTKVEATVDSIEKAMAAWSRTEERFAKARAKYLEGILPEAYAVVKNAARRLCGSEIRVNGHPLRWQMVHFDVQLIGGIALHRGMIAEMQTGEGKTLVATLPVYLNALTGLGVHVVTVNDYLAERDSQWMGALFRSLGLTVGCIISQMAPEKRRLQYECDITYGTNAEFGFDYLRDNGVAVTRDEQVQRGHYFALIDEVDSILIDEARTPLIITGPAPKPSHEMTAHQLRVERLVRRQTELCNGLAVEVKRALDAGDMTAAGMALYKLKLGQPRNRRLIRYMEDPELRRLLEKTELKYHKDNLKIKEELYFTVDEKRNDADLTEKGRRELAPDDPESFTLPDVDAQLATLQANLTLNHVEKDRMRGGIEEMMRERAAKVHHISQLLKAYCLYERDVHYVVNDGKVTIIDESTGREMPGRRWSDGLHQAVEAKEKVAIERETRTYATITVQNYFRIYEKLAGMTGTAETEAAEFHDIYQLDVLPIPTNLRNIRIDGNDRIFKTRRDKFNAVVQRIVEIHSTGQPVLVGTASVEASETLSRMLKRAKIEHSVLNAKLHAQEAEIVAKAGQKGAVTVSTNMAGRGTDIALGDGAAELGGLFVIGTERHTSRRVDRQLRGRCARQGDPGHSEFYISLEDELMRNHAAPEQMAGLIERAGRTQSLGSLVENAQKRVEQRDYRSRKQVLDFDDVMNLHRGIVYGLRNEVLRAEDTRTLVRDLIIESVSAWVSDHAPEGNSQDLDHEDPHHWISRLPAAISTSDLAGRSREELAALLTQRLGEAYSDRARGLSMELLDYHERRVILLAIDDHWQEHLEQMEELRDGVFLRSQGDPLVEYKNEAYRLFSTLMANIHREALENLFRVTSYLQHLSAGGQALPIAHRAE